LLKACQMLFDARRETIDDGVKGNTYDNGVRGMDYGLS